MSHSFVRSFRRSVIGGVALAGLLPALAVAQESPASEAEGAAASDEIIVTGTLIRGAAPVGSSLISVGQEALTATGATTSNELLASIPQVSNYFNRVPAADLAIAANQIQISRPNLRSLSSPNAANSPTLILFDGHRIATAGTKQASVDPDVIPAGAIERVEVVTEGGSAIYGADAVAGVINFITRKRFDGVKADARYGFADNYWQVDANATVGKDWGTGSAYVSYTFTKNRALFDRDRDYIRGLDYTAQPYLALGRQCDPGNVRLTGPAANYRVQDLTTPGINYCDLTDDASAIPEAERHGVVASLYQELSPSTTIQLKAFYSQRETTALNTYRGTVNIGTNNPFYRQVTGRPNETQTVDFSFAPALGRSTAPSRVKIQEWGANAEITQKLDDNWQLRGLFNYSRSNSEYSIQSVNNGRLTTAGNSVGLTTATAINPYNVAATNPALLADLIDNFQAGQAKNELLDLRAVLDGRLFSLPGGDVRVAVGYEYMFDQLRNREADNLRAGGLRSVAFNRYSRKSHSLFGELIIPVFGPDNAVGGIQSLQISAQGRWDHYSDFGGTFNPKFGITYKPADWITFRGNWGKSYQAPGLSDSKAAITTLSIIPFPIIPNPYQPPVAGDQPYLAIQGGGTNLRPQTAKTYSFGAEVKPIDGLTASLTYYNIDFKDLVDIPPIGDAATFFKYYTGNFIMNPSEAQVAAWTSGIPAAANQLAGAALYAPGKPTVYAIVNISRTNLSRVKLSGLDFNISYTRETGFGSIDASFSGNYQLSRKTQSVVTLPFNDDLAQGMSRFNFVARAGADIGNFRAQATLYHNAGYALNPLPANDFQSRVGAFDVVDLFFKYDVPGEGALKDLSLTLNINNVFNAAPPVWKTFDFTNAGYTNGFTLGRIFQFGARKKF